MRASGWKKTKLQSEFETKAQKIHSIAQLLKAYSLYTKDVEYVVQETKVIIVDQNTGRLMTGRRWSDGLHQSVEAKGKAGDRTRDADAGDDHDSKLLPPLPKLAGMTGNRRNRSGRNFTTSTNSACLVIPTNKAVSAQRCERLVYKTRREKFNAVLAEIKRVHGEGRPILVGTISVESVKCSKMLNREKPDSLGAQREVSPAGS